jgi:hypothetical protein
MKKITDIKFLLCSMLDSVLLMLTTILSYNCINGKSVLPAGTRVNTSTAVQVLCSAVLYNKDTFKIPKLSALRLEF